MPAEEQAPDETGPVDKDSRHPLVLALRAFQHDEGLEQTGRFDDATRDKLVARHGI